MDFAARVLAGNFSIGASPASMVARHSPAADACVHDVFDGGAANSAIGAAAADAGDDMAPDNSGGGDRAGGPGSEDQNKPLVGSRTPGLREVRYELVSAERLLDHAEKGTVTLLRIALPA